MTLQLVLWKFSSAHLNWRCWATASLISNYKTPRKWLSSTESLSRTPTCLSITDTLYIYLNDLKGLPAHMINPLFFPFLVSFTSFSWTFLLSELEFWRPGFTLTLAPLSGKRCVILLTGPLTQEFFNWVELWAAGFVTVGLLAGIRGPSVAWLWCLCFPLWSTWCHSNAEVSYAGPRRSSMASSSCSEWPICSDSSSCDTLGLKSIAHPVLSRAIFRGMVVLAVLTY